VTVNSVGDALTIDGQGGTADTITVNGPITTSGGDVRLTASGGVALSGAAADVTTGGGSFIVNADSAGNGTGTFTQDNAGSAIDAGAGGISITAVDVALSGTTAGTGSLTILPSQAASTIGLGGGAGTLNLGDSDLATLADGFSSIIIGDVRSQVANGTFDTDLSRWTATGHVGPFSGVVDFNGGDLSPDGVLSQKLEVIAGASSSVTFDIGTIGFVPTTTVGLRADVLDTDGTTVLATLDVNRTGPSATTSHSLTFTPTGSTVTLRFTDISAGTASLDVTLDNVAVAGPGTVTIASAAFTDPVAITGGSISVTELAAGTSAVTLTATTGSIADGGDVGLDITGGAVTLNAANGTIGAAGGTRSLWRRRRWSPTRRRATERSSSVKPTA